jgi:hypothetical protein
MRIDERVAKELLNFLKRKNVSFVKDGTNLSETDVQALVKEFIAARSKE